MSDRDTVASPVSTTDYSSIIMMLHQLQQDIDDIRQALHVDEDNETVMTTGIAVRNCSARMNERRLSSQTVNVNRWTRPVAEIQEAQGILRRLRRNNKLHSAVV
jgi:hypothetical protein